MANKNATKVWKTAAYIRLSREDGDRPESESVVNQRQIIDDFITSQPDLGGYTEFIDDGATGTNFNRTGFQDMLTEIKNGNINCVVVKDLSRFGRNYTEAGTYMEQIFPMFDVRFISINDHIDSFTRPTEMDSILVPLKNLLNDSYSKDLSVKIKSSLTAKRKRGEFIGAFAPYGYMRDMEDKSKLIVDEGAADVVRNIFDWYVNGMSKTGIAKKLNMLHIPSPAKYRVSKYPTRKQGEYAKKLDGLWSSQRVYGILENPVYCGHISQGKRTCVSYKNDKQIKIPKENWIIVENTHEPIVDERTFQKAQELSQLTVRESPQTGRIYLFSGLLKCADCNRSMDRTTVQKPNKLYTSYRCSTYSRLSKEACTRHGISEDKLASAVLKAIQTYVTAFVDINDVTNCVERAKRRNARIEFLQKQLASTKSELNDIERIRLCLHTDFKKNIITQDEYIALKSGYAAQADKLNDAIVALNVEIEVLNNQEITQNELLERFRQYGNFDSLDRKMVVDLIDKIDVHEDGQVHIHFKFKNPYEDSGTETDMESEQIAI